MEQWNNGTIIKLCQSIITYSFYLLFFFVPLIMTPLNYELFEFNKMLLVYFFTTIIAGAWLVKSVLEGKFQLTRTPLDLPILLFLASQIISTIISVDPHISLWGYYGRFNGGLLSTISYIILYYAFVSHRSHKSYKSHETYKFLLFSLASGFLVSLYALLQKLGIDKNIWVQDVQARPFATLGQPNWLAAYLAVLLPITMAITLKSKGQSANVKSNPKLKAQKNSSFGFWNLKLICNLDFGIWILALLFYTVLLFTRSRSGFLAFWLANGAFWLLLHKSHKSHFLRFLLIFNLSFLILTFLIGSPFPQINKFSLSSFVQMGHAPSLPSTTAPVPTDVTESGEIRTIVWRGALEAAKARPLFGWGVETFAWVYYKFKPVEHNLTSEWDFLYNKAHNEYLNYAATTGLAGLGSYLLIIGGFIIWFLRNLKWDVGNENNPVSHLPLRTSLLAGWLSILITNFFGFSVVPTVLYFWLIPAMSFSLSPHKSPPKHRLNKDAIATLLSLSCLFFIFYLLFSIFNLWLSDYHFAKTHSLNRAGDYQQAYQEIKKAIKFNPGEPLYHDELSTISSSLAVSLSGEDLSRLEPAAGSLEREALAASDFAVKSSPHNLNFLKTRTRMFYTLNQLPALSLEPAASSYLRRALEAILIAQKLAPTDAKISYNLALIFEANGQREKAIETLKKTLELKPNYQDAQEALKLFLEE